MGRDDDRGTGCGPGRGPWDWIEAGVWRQHRPGQGPWGEGHGWGGPRHGGPGGRGRPGPPPWLAGLFGAGRPAPAPGPRVRRGDVRTAVLGVLAEAGEAGEQPNGYQVIQRIGERSGGAWRPSPGSVYPTVQQLQDEGLVRAEEEAGGRRTLALTDEGRAHVAEHAEEVAAVWAPFAEPEAPEPGRMPDLKPEIGQVMSAVWQIVSGGSEEQRRAAAEVLVDARRRLYGILADGPDAGSGDGDDDGVEEPRA